MNIVESDLQTLLTTGCDERIFLLPEYQTNKYFINSFSHPEALMNRGSCTCGGLTTYTQQVAASYLEELEHRPHQDLVDAHSRRLKEMINFEGEDRFEVFFGPSGSHLVYYPLLFHKILYPGQQVISMLTCTEELGSGSKVAAAGQHFAQYNQFDEKVQEEEMVTDMNIDLTCFSARDEQGNIIKSGDAIREMIKKYPEQPKIVGLVHGSKSGIKDNLKIIEEYDDEKIFWIVDLCQFRNSKELINKLLDNHCMVFITGSKFYQAPPFCGAMLTPKKTVERLKAKDFETGTLGFKEVFTRYDLPNSLPGLKDEFREDENNGLRLRWECAISEMEKYDNTSSAACEEVILSWNNTIMKTIAAKDILELLPYQESTNDSIISFRVRRQDGSFMDYDELKTLHKSIALADYNELGEFEKVFIGQPVKYGEKSFIRLALGAYNVRNLVGQDDPDLFEKDIRLVDLIVEKAKALW